MTNQIVIPTVATRVPQAWGLALQTGGDFVIDPVGDGTEQSATDNHIRAMLTASTDVDWVVILEDDAVPIEGFSEILGEQLDSTSPDKIVSLYLGKAMPPSIQPTIRRTLESMPDDTSWLTTRSLYWGVGVCIPTQYVDSVADHVLRLTKPWDTAVGHWALVNQREVWYSWPSLVDHLDEETTINHSDGMGRSPGRVAWATGRPIPGGRSVMIE